VYRLAASDTVYADSTAWGGITAAQVFVGKLSQYVAVYGCKSDAEFARTLEDEIRKRGAMDKLVTDRAQAEISKKVKDILRALFIQDWQSEAYYHHQLFVERIIKELKKFANWVLNWSDAPPEAWYLVFEYVAFIMNRTAKEKLDGAPRLKLLLATLPMSLSFYTLHSGNLYSSRTTTVQANAFPLSRMRLLFDLLGSVKLLVIQ